MDSLKVLIIGRKAAGWAEGLAERAFEVLEVDAARLPAAGLRQFESTPPDALVVVESASTERAGTLVDAVRERPLGRLIPIAVIAPPPTDEQAGEVDAWLSPEATVDDLAESLAEHLEVDLSGASAAPEESTDAGSPSGAAPADRTIEEPAYYIEEIDDGEPQPASGSDREAIFSTPASGPAAGPVDDVQVDREAIERKFRQVRHEDYYTILEVRRGARQAAVRDAFHRLYRRFDPEELDFQLARRFEEEIAEIRDALEDAWAVLGDPNLREDYLEHTTKK